MTDNQHKQSRAAMLCIAAFAVGCVLSFSGCSAVNKTETKAFGEKTSFGVGVYLNEDID
jgi:hypothetical protein